MSLNQINLTPQLLTDLYANALIETHAIAMPSNTPPAESTKSAPVNRTNYLGNNRKNILVIVNDDRVNYLTDEELTFFTKVLNACELGLDDVAIINWSRLQQKDYQLLLDELNSKTVLLFNLTPIEFGLPLHFPPFQTQEFDRRIYLQAPSLGSIEQDVAAKKQLWNSLKKLFAI
jgi:DNA polymerase III psi subunit